MPRTKEVIVLYTDDGIGNSIGEIVGEVVRCKDCIHRPIPMGKSAPVAPLWMNPEVGYQEDDMTCPYLCDDNWYNKMPDDNGYCDKGERKEESL